MKINTYKDQALITQELEILVEEDFPYFFIGKNKFGKFVVASLADYDESNGEKLLLYAIATEEILLNHFKGNISYLSLLRKAQAIYEVRESIKTGESVVKPITFSQIPDDILPQNTSFYFLDLPNCVKELEKIVITQEQPNKFSFFGNKQTIITNKNNYKNAAGYNQLPTVQKL